MSVEAYVTRDHQCFMHKVPFYFGENDKFDPINLGYFTTKYQTVGMIFDIQCICENSPVYAFNLSSKPVGKCVTSEEKYARHVNCHPDCLEMFDLTAVPSDATGEFSADAASVPPTSAVAIDEVHDSAAIFDYKENCHSSLTASGVDKFKRLFLSAKSAVADLRKAQEEVLHISRLRSVEPILLYFQIGDRVYPLFFFAPKPVPFVFVCHMGTATIINFDRFAMSDEEKAIYDAFVKHSMFAQRNWAVKGEDPVYISCRMRDKWHHYIIPEFSAMAGATHVRCGKQSFTVNFCGAKLEKLSAVDLTVDRLKMFLTFDCIGYLGRSHRFPIFGQGLLVEECNVNSIFVRARSTRNQILELLPQAKGCIKFSEDRATQKLKRPAQSAETSHGPKSDANDVWSISDFILYSVFSENRDGVKSTDVRPIYYYLISLNPKSS